MARKKNLYSMITKIVDLAQDAQDIIGHRKITAKEIIAAMNDDEDEASKLWAWLVMQSIVMVGDDGHDLVIYGPPGWDFKGDGTFVAAPDGDPDNIEGCKTYHHGPIKRIRNADKELNASLKRYMAEHGAK